MRNIFSTCIYHYVKQISAEGVAVGTSDKGRRDRVGVGVVVRRGEPQTSRIVWSAELFMRILVCYSL